VRLTVTALPDYLVLDPSIEKLPIERLRTLQSERLRATVQYVYDRAPFWRRKFEAIGLKPADIRGLDDLPRIPYCTREELQADQRAHPPFGSYLACDPRALVRFMSTSGTTGRPLRRVFSARDWGYVLDRMQRNSPLSPGDVVVTLSPIDGLMGPTASAESSARAGALVVLAGLQDSAGKVRLIEELRPTLVSGAASYLLHLIEVARQEGIDLATLGIRTVISVGEPGAAVPATHRRLTEGWGAFVRDGYGLTELFPLGGGCGHSSSLHIASDLVITEIVDHDSGASVPRGEPGEVVYTNIVGDSQPLLRYRTRDIARLAPDEPCVCGFTGARLAHAIEGRADEMIWLRGVNVFPSAIEAVVRGFQELDDEYELVVDEREGLPALHVRAELRPGLSESLPLAARVRRALTQAIRVSSGLELLPFGTLPRADARAKKRRVRRVRNAPHDAESSRPSEVYSRPRYE
jgi:phenylacetate-CoA ligase